eukprot:632872-Pleurochrysis_carterae.AAC.2
MDTQLLFESVRICSLLAACGAHPGQQRAPGVVNDTIGTQQTSSPFSTISWKKVFVPLSAAGLESKICFDFTSPCKKLQPSHALRVARTLSIEALGSKPLTKVLARQI